MPFFEALLAGPNTKFYRGGYSVRPSQCLDIKPQWEALQMEMSIWQAIARTGGLDRVAVRPNCREYFDVIPPYIAMPRDGQRFEATNSIEPPAAGNTQRTVIYRVQGGYRGIIQSIVCRYDPASGTYGPGPGDLSWSLRIGTSTAKGYGLISVPLGSLQDRFSLEGAGFFVEPGDSIVFSTRQATGGSVSGGFVTCSVAGYLWPI